MNLFNRIKLLSTALVLAAAALPALAQQGDPQVINIPLSRPGEPITLEIGILSAHIEVIGENREDAEFEVTVGQSQRKIITPSGAVPVTGGGFELSVEEENNHIDVDADWRAKRIHIVARIPRRADLDLGTTNDGVIIVRNVEGDLELRNTNGPITVTGLSGSVIAESVNDNILVDFVRLGGDAANSLSSVNGDLTVGVPDGAGAEFMLDTARGEIYSDFEVVVKPTQPKFHREEGNGGVEVKVESTIVAEVNGGGPRIRLKTLNGDIQIRKAQ